MESLAIYYNVALDDTILCSMQIDEFQNEKLLALPFTNLWYINMVHLG